MYVPKTTFHARLFKSWAPHCLPLAPWKSHGSSQNKIKILTCFHTVLECKSFTRIILITVKDEPQCCSIACYSFSKILWGSFTAMSWCLTIIGIVVLSARSRSKSCKKKMNLLRPALRHFVFTWLQQRQAVVSV